MKIDEAQRERMVAQHLRARDIRDRRVLDAQVLFSLKNYEEAATILLDVVEKYPNSRAHDDALFLLGESLYQGRDVFSARRYFEQFVSKKTGSRQEQDALQRLVEISRVTGESSCQSRTSPSTPERIVISMTITPRPMTTCVGRMRVRFMA